MTFKFKLPGFWPGHRKSTDAVGSRMILALSLSVILHIVIVIATRPDYKPVADHVVDFTVTNVKPGPPKKKPAKTPSPEKKVDEPKPEPKTKEPPKKPKPAKGPKPAKDKDGPKVATSENDNLNSSDGGPEDAGIIDEAVGEDIATIGEASGTGICMPNLFPFVRVDSSWMLWVSLSSFRETSLQDSVGSTLARFTVGSQVNKATGLDPKTDVEGIMVSAQDVFEGSSYRVIIGYDSGEDKLREQLTENKVNGLPMAWIENPQGSTGVSGNSFWHLAGSGRVLVTGYEKPNSDKKPQFDPKWPSQIECVSPRSMQPKELSPEEKQSGEIKELTELAKSIVGPDSNGRWPVALLATSDPRTIGLGSGKSKGTRFEHATIRAFFSDPIRIEGEVLFRGKDAKIKALAQDWQRMATTVSKDPFFIMAGLSNLFDKLTLQANGKKIVFSLTLTEGQARAALLFLQLQGEVLERHLKDQ